MSKNYQPQVLEVLKEIDFDATNYQIELNTSHGRIVLDLLPDVAPGHCGNMIGLTKIGYYDGLTFHRTTTKDFLNWGGLNERWFMDAEDRWYYVTPEGSVYRWQVGSKLSTGGLTGTLVASLSSAHYQDLHLITEPDLRPLTVYVDPDGTSEDLLFGNHRLLDSLLGQDL